jgi:hypothetical protein
MIRLLLTLVLCHSLSAATLYVATTGSDSRTYVEAQNPATPWATIGKAATLVAAGDTVNVAAGTYAESVTLTISGIAASPIRWVGAANHASIIDPSTASASGWVEHVATGVGVYRKAMTKPGIVTADGYCVQEARDIYALTRMDWDTDKIVYPSNLGSVASDFWDGYEAFWAHDGTYTYIRFRDRSDANGKTIRVSGVSPSTAVADTIAAPIKITASYNQVSGFTIRGGFHAVLLAGTSATVVGNVIESNKIQYGYSQVFLSGTGTASNAVVGNWMSPTLYAETAGVTSGAWRSADSSTDYNFNGYQWSKDYWSGMALELFAVKFRRSGSSNLISGNVLSNGAGGIILDNDGAASASRTVVSSNTVINMSAGGVFANRHDLAQLHDNEFRDVHFPFRMQNLNATRAGSHRVYAYRNKSWNPANRGTFTYLHGVLSDTYQSEIWFYHNSYEGGYAALTASSRSAPYLQQVRFLNNIISSTVTAQSSYWSTLGNFSYNLVSQLSGDWYDAGNILNPSPYEWGGATASASVPDFLITTNSLAWNAGTNLTGLSLPETATINGGAWDIGWHELDTDAQTPPTYIAALSSQVFEIGSATAVRITRSGTTAGALSGTMTISGTAVSGVNYQPISTSWTIPSGSSYVDITITPINDGERTGDLTITFTLAPGAGYTVVGDGVTVTFKDSAQDQSIPRTPALPGSFRPPIL